MGIVLVFDLDQTIVDSTNPKFFDNSLRPGEKRRMIKESLNMNIVNLLIRASKLRPSGKVTAICLLTNNSSMEFVKLVDDILKEFTGSVGSYGKKAVEDGFEEGDYFFDAIMTREHIARPKTPSGNPPKRLEDINKMLEPFDLKFGSATMDDLFFFDDLPNHQIMQTYKEVGDFRENYIEIKPRYTKYTKDTTNYSPILRALANLDGEAATLPEPPPPQQNPSLVAPSRNSGEKKLLGIPTAPLSQAPSKGTLAPPVLALPAKARTVGRNRSNAKVNANNLGLPLPPQMQSIRSKPQTPRRSLVNAFTRPTKGGRLRKTRKLYRRKRRVSAKRRH